MRKGVEMLEPMRQKYAQNQRWRMVLGIMYMVFNFSKLRSGDVRLLEVVPWEAVPWEVVRH